MIALPSTEVAPALARSFLNEWGRELPPDVLADALLVVSELVTNAIRHGKPTVTLNVSVDPPGIGIAVDDAGQALPDLAAQRPSADATTGRGLLIVDTLATRWGVTANQPPPGKTVWFELQPDDRQV